MCGLVAIAHLQGRPVSPAVLESMHETLRHLGPDAGDIRLHNVGLGHRRLAVLDLSDRAAQPMSNEDDTSWLVFNGEIYNDVELRQRLAERGHRFKSPSSAAESRSTGAGFAAEPSINTRCQASNASRLHRKEAQFRRMTSVSIPPCPARRERVACHVL